MARLALPPAAAILAAYARARWLAARLNSRARIEAWQQRRLRDFLNRRITAVDAYRDQAGRPLDTYPALDKATMMARFERYNTLRLEAAAARAAWQAGQAPPGFAIGASTGTSGNRGYYVISDAERHAWLGVILARGLPGFWRQQLRLAVMLPTNSRLYDAANESGRLALRFFDLNAGVESQAAAVEAWQPDVLIAPPKVLRLLADRDSALAPTHVFSGAEVLDPIDRAIVEARFSCVVREIYMATEGLFAVACPHGRLHLLEDHVLFEWDDADGAGGLKAPVITDFTRRHQIMLRYRMNDLLELDSQACPCGSSFTAVRAVAGRLDDVFRLNTAAGGRIAVTPDVIRNAVVDASPRIDDFRVVQNAPDRVELSLPRSCAAELGAAKCSLAALFDRLGAAVTLTAELAELPPPGPGKLRRVRRTCA
ncbi:F390 synthetase-related protein [Maricaulis maris]|uniref:Putative adenylate-forming enzyme n=1 Tax=Maricaulis maris TaxID=74318 RepID=A0A495DKS5_9PROT|nr:F390 synthetase-related protein [Maricaulis maris]RKR03220.1 putative adenylate-forming enzyme [Maricaulis maris]